MKRRFELINYKSNKFWEISSEDNLDSGIHIIIINYGRIGTKGQFCVHEFNDIPSARTFQLKIIRQKIKKGYREIALVH